MSAVTENQTQEWWKTLFEDTDEKYGIRQQDYKNSKNPQKGKHTENDAWV